jgi:hypothetical membrane protein
MTQATRALLWCAVCVPLLYFGTLLLSALFFPGYSHVTQYASELGSAEAPYPAIFNAGIFLTGVAGVGAGVGFARAVTALGGHRVVGALAGLCVGLFGVSLVMGAAFPMPDPRHAAFGLGMAIQLAPFFLAAALRTLPEVRNLRTFLIIVGLAMLILFAIMMGAGAMVRRSNVGLFQRAYALTTFPWVGVAGFVLGRRLRGRV